MKKAVMILLAMTLAVALALPASAADFKYGGYLRVRLYSSDNVADGTDQLDDDYNRIDQRLRMYFYFVASENFRLVTKWEVNTVWGQAASGGDVGADSNNFLMKNVYADINIPGTPLNAKIGVQGITLMDGWITADDFSGLTLTAKFNQFQVMGGYIGARNEDFTTTEDNIDDLWLALNYANGPWKAGLYGFYQYARNTLNTKSYSILPAGTDSNLFDLGLELGYAADKFDFMAQGIVNLGSYDDLAGDSQDYKGWMIAAKGNYYINNLALTLGGFYTSGDDDPADGNVDNFVYPDGRSYYWAEIAGYGTMDIQSLGGHPGWAADDGPSNLWTIQAGVAWQALEKTKLTFNYYYIGTAEDVVSEPDDTSSEVGNEFDLYIDQKLIDGLKLRLVGAYLLAGDARTPLKDDDDAYQVGARLDWSF